MNHSWTLDAARTHLAQSDKVMAILTKAYTGCPLLQETQTPFAHIIIAIINQLLSYQSADAIEKRVQHLVGQLEPQAMVKVSDEDLRAAGLSWRKVDYVKDISRRVLDGKLDFDKLANMDDKEVEKELVKIRGIGPWSAHMLLISGFKRADILAPGDVGLQRATSKLYGAHFHLEEVSAPWHPYCTLACWYLWQYIRNPDAYNTLAK